MGNNVSTLIKIGRQKLIKLVDIGLTWSKWVMLDNNFFLAE